MRRKKLIFKKVRNAVEMVVIIASYLTIAGALDEQSEVPVIVAIIAAVIFGISCWIHEIDCK